MANHQGAVARWLLWGAGAEMELGLGLCRKEHELPLKTEADSEEANGWRLSANCTPHS